MKIYIIASALVLSIPLNTYAASLRYCDPINGTSLAYQWAGGPSGTLSGKGGGSSTSHSCNTAYCEISIGNQYTGIGNPPYPWPQAFGINSASGQVYVVPCQNQSTTGTLFFIYDAPCDVTKNDCNSACFTQRTPHCDPVFFPAQPDMALLYCNQSGNCDITGLCPKNQTPPPPPCTQPAGN